MNPKQAIQFHIKGLKAEIKKYENALALISEQHEDKGIPSNSELDAQVLDHLEAHPGVKVNTVAEDLGLSYQSVYNSILRLVKSRKVEQSNKPMRQHKRYAVRAAKETPKEEVKVTPRGASKKPSSSKVKRESKKLVNTQNQIRDLATSRPWITTTVIVENFGATRAMAQQAIENLIDAEVLVQDGMAPRRIKNGKEVGRAAKKYKSLLYKPERKPMSIRPGEEIKYPRFGR